MLRPTTLCRATLPLRQLITPLTPAAAANPTKTTTIIQQQQARAKSTINKHRQPKKKFLDLREQLASDLDRNRAEAGAAKAAKAAAEAKAKEQLLEKIANSGGPPPFVISRTASQNLPIYLRDKRGGTKKLTLIRKLEGDRNVLADWLAHDFGLKRSQVVVKSPTNHIEMEGHYRQELMKWFEAKGF